MSMVSSFLACLRHTENIYGDWVTPPQMVESRRPHDLPSPLMRSSTWWARLALPLIADGLLAVRRNEMGYELHSLREGERETWRQWTGRADVVTFNEEMLEEDDGGKK